MKLGDVVMSTKVRPYENAVCIQVDISNRIVDGKPQTRTKYVAKYSDGSLLHFHGANVNKSVFKVCAADGQITLEDYFTMQEMEGGESDGYE